MRSSSVSLALAVSTRLRESVEVAADGALQAVLHRLAGVLKADILAVQIRDDAEPLVIGGVGDDRGADYVEHAWAKLIGPRLGQDL